MPRHPENLIKKTIRLNAGDTEELDSYYPTLGYNKVIRELVHRHLVRLRERTNRRLGAVSSADIPDKIEVEDDETEEPN